MTVALVDKIAWPVSNNYSIKPSVDTVGKGGYNLLASSDVDAVIKALFANSEQGAWYDPSDFSSMFQDSTGTTPVTAVGQPVGLILDKSKGLVLGSELITNAADREFSSDTGFWAKDGGSTISGGVVNINNVPGTWAIAKLNFPNIGDNSNQYYEIAFDLTITQGTLEIVCGAANGSAITTSGRVVQRLLRPAVGTFGIRPKAGSPTVLGTIDNLTIKQVTGNHAIQATSASRPVLSARLNLLTKTEQFDDAAWSVDNGSTKTGTNVAVAPDGATTADAITFAANSSSSLYYSYFPQASTYTFSVWVKVSSGTKAIKLGHYSAANGLGFSSVFTVTTTWQRVQYTRTIAAAASSFFMYNGDANAGEILVWGAQLETGSVASTYQRVNTASDYDSVGFPHYLEFDGVDDSLKSSVFSSNITTPTNIFGIALNSHVANRYVYDGATTDSMELYQNGSSGMVSMYAGAAGSTTVGPLTLSTPFVLTNQFNTSNGKLRLNGIGGTVSTGAVNTNALTLFISGGGAAPSAGRMYSFICRGALSTTQEITDTETWVNSKTAAY